MAQWSERGVLGVGGVILYAVVACASRWLLYLQLSGNVLVYQPQQQAQVACCCCVCSLLEWVLCSANAAECVSVAHGLRLSRAVVLAIKLTGLVQAVAMCTLCSAQQPLASTPLLSTTAACLFIWSTRGF
jgi:hypothetical protein